MAGGGGLNPSTVKEVDELPAELSGLESRHSFAQTLVLSWPVRVTLQRAGYTGFACTRRDMILALQTGMFQALSLTDCYHSTRLPERLRLP